MIIRLAVASFLLIPAVAMAQGNPGPYGRLFGRQPAGAGQDTTVVEARSGIGAQYDTALLPPEGSDILETPTGMGAVGSAGIVLDHKAGRWVAYLSGGAARQQYLNSDEPFGVNQYGANARLAAPITDRLDAEASASYFRSPTFQYLHRFVPDQSLLIDEPIGPFSPYAVAMLQNESVDLTGSLNMRITKSSTLSATVIKHQTRFAEQSSSNFDSLGYGVRWNQRISRGFGLHAGYHREEIDSVTVTGLPYVHENIDVGIDFNHAVSLARRTTLAFTTSTSIIKQTGFEQQFHVNGSVVLAKFFRRTWEIGASATRSTEFTPGFVQPLYTDSAGAFISGMFTTRLEFSTIVVGGRGEYAFTGTSGFDTVSASSRLSFALNRYFEMYGQYVAFLSEVPTGTTTLNLPARTGRQMVSVGVGTYIPVYRKVRQGQ